MKTMTKREIASRKRVEDLIPSMDQLDRILPTLRQAHTEPLCGRCRSFKHRGRCAKAQDS